MADRGLTKTGPDLVDRVLDVTPLRRIRVRETGWIRVRCRGIVARPDADQTIGGAIGFLFQQCRTGPEDHISELGRFAQGRTAGFQPKPGVL